MRPAVVVLALLSACGGPVVDETSSPVGVVIDAVADPEVYTACRISQAEAQALITQTTPGCFCETECTGSDLPVDGRCVPPDVALAPGAHSEGTGGACFDFMARGQRAQGCEVPVWPLARCASID